MDYNLEYCHYMFLTLTCQFKIIIFNLDELLICRSYMGTGDTWDTRLCHG